MPAAQQIATRLAALNRQAGNPSSSRVYATPAILTNEEFSPGYTAFMSPVREASRITMPDPTAPESVATRSLIYHTQSPNWLPRLE